MGNLLDEIQDKLNKLLDNDLAICQHYSSIVIILYKKILAHLNGEIDINCFRDDINELIVYIEKENESFRKLLSYDRITLLPKINYHIEKEEGPPEYLRFVNKLRFIKNIYDEFKISFDELGIGKVSSDIEFDIYSAMFSIIYIEVFRNILDKFDSLSYDCEQDEMFIKKLYSELNFKIIYRCSCNDLFEIISLHCDIDINKFPDISMDILKEHLVNIYKSTDIDDHFNEILYSSIVNDIMKMKSKCYLNNNPEDIFDYLYFTTKLNVIMSYLNKNYLLKLFDYCNTNSFNNNYICGDIKRLIRTRLGD